MPNTPTLAFLREVDPIPAECEKYDVALLERDIYGHLGSPTPDAPRISIPAQGARLMLDIAYALRMETQAAPATSVCEMKFPPSLFGIELPVSQSGEVAIRSSGMCMLTLGEKSGRWKCAFWFDMREISGIGSMEPSHLAKDWNAVGNMEVSIYSFSLRIGEEKQSSYTNENMIAVPILSLGRLTKIASRIVPWHGVDPARDGRLGVPGYLLEEQDRIAQYCALDIFARTSGVSAPRKYEGGIAIACRLADSAPTGAFGDAILDAEDAIAPEMRHFLIRALVDLNVTWNAIEPHDRYFHNNPHIEADFASAVLDSHGLELVNAPGRRDILKDGESLLEGEAEQEDFCGGKIREYYIARFIDNLLHPLRGRPFLYRRNIIMHAPLDVVQRFLPGDFSHLAGEKRDKDAAKAPGAKTRK